MEPVHGYKRFALYVTSINKISLRKRVIMSLQHFEIGDLQVSLIWPTRHTSVTGSF